MSLIRIAFDHYVGIDDTRYMWWYAGTVSLVTTPAPTRAEPDRTIQVPCWHERGRPALGQEDGDYYHPIEYANVYGEARPEQHVVLREDPECVTKPAYEAVAEMPNRFGIFALSIAGVWEPVTVRPQLVRLVNVRRDPTGYAIFPTLDVVNVSQVDTEEVSKAFNKASEPPEYGPVRLVHPGLIVSV